MPRAQAERQGKVEPEGCCLCTHAPKLDPATLSIRFSWSLHPSIGAKLAKPNAQLPNCATGGDTIQTRRGRPHLVQLVPYTVEQVRSRNDAKGNPPAPASRRETKHRARKQSGRRCLRYPERCDYRKRSAWLGKGNGRYTGQFRSVTGAETQRFVSRSDSALGVFWGPSGLLSE